MTTLAVPPGAAFGRLTVVEEAPRMGARGLRAMLCRCECGTEKVVRLDTLTGGGTTSCGCAWREGVMLDVPPGTVFGRLTVIEEGARAGARNARTMLCRCECGTMKIVGLDNLTRGATTSCGCARRGRIRVDVPPGTVFGHLAVIREAGVAASRDRLMLCGCECGSQTTVKLNNLRNGHTKSCGCRGFGPDLLALKPGEVPLYGKKAAAAGAIALVDIEDYALVMKYRWHLVTTTRNGPRYAAGVLDARGGNLEIAMMHRFLTGWPLTDHIDGNGLNNRRSNLRPATQSQNMWNSGSRGGSSQFKGVCWVKGRGKWRAEITVNRKAIHLGYFTDETEAAQAYDAAALRLHGEFARPNLPAA